MGHLLRLEARHDDFNPVTNPLTNPLGVEGSQVLGNFLKKLKIENQQ
jgi:hypothetical protein